MVIMFPLIKNGKEFTVATKKDVTFDNVTAKPKITAPEVGGLNKHNLYLSQLQKLNYKLISSSKNKPV